MYKRQVTAVIGLFDLSTHVSTGGVVGVVSIVLLSAKVIKKLITICVFWVAVTSRVTALPSEMMVKAVSTLR